MKKHIICFIRKLEKNLFCRNNSLRWINIGSSLISPEIRLHGSQRSPPMERKYLWMEELVLGHINSPSTYNQD